MSEPSRERLEWAVKVLDERKHRGRIGWEIMPGGRGVQGPYWDDALTAWEAVAIASAYEGEDAARRIVAAIEQEAQDAAESVGGVEWTVDERFLAGVVRALEVAMKAAGITEGGQP